MTLIVGIKCLDAVVLAADSAATFATGERMPTIRQTNFEKLVIPDSTHLIVGVSGPVGLAQRIGAALGSAARTGAFADSQRDKLLLALRQVYWNAIGVEFDVARYTRKQPAVGSLLAMEVDGEPSLLEIEADGAPEEKPRGFVSVGSGQLIADSFLAFLSRVFWRDGSHCPSVSEGLCAAFWTLEHAVRVNPGGVDRPIRAAVLEKTPEGCVARHLAGEPGEHAQWWEAAERHLSEYSAELGEDEDVSKIPAPDNP